MDICSSKLNYTTYDIQTPKMRIEINGPSKEISDIISKAMKDLQKNKARQDNANLTPKS
jgi:hypothetical protein